MTPKEKASRTGEALFLSFYYQDNRAGGLTSEVSWRVSRGDSGGVTLVGRCKVDMAGGGNAAKCGEMGEWPAIRPERQCIMRMGDSGVVSSQQLEHWAILRSELLRLRHLFAQNAQQPGGLDYFDALLEANEYEVALHALCQCIVAAPAPRITDEEVERIDLLHTRMDLIDGCVESIRRKQSPSSD
jgi:hypothetical protein